jgi:SpoIIAA-like
MIEVQLFRDDGVAVVFPSGALTAADFDEIAALVDPFIEANGELKGLMIVADRFPGWESLGALIDHVRFVRDHHKLIRRIAAVSDSATLTVLPQLARHFVKAEVRHFPFAARDAAMAWLKAAP